MGLPASSLTAVAQVGPGRGPGCRGGRCLWAAQEVREKTHGLLAFAHPLVGHLDVSYEALRLADDPDQVLVTYSVEPGSPDEAALALLASLTAPPADRLMSGPGPAGGPAG